MLAQILAIAVALGSAILFLTAFLFPKLHRQDDFFWSAVGLFYALVLWICAGQIAGAVLLGQTASVILLGWFAWETLRLRQAIIDPTKIPDLDKVSLVSYIGQRFKKKPKPIPTTPATSSTQVEQTATDTPTTPPESPAPEAADTKPQAVISQSETAAATPETSDQPVADSSGSTEEIIADEPVSDSTESTQISSEVTPESPTTPSGSAKTESTATKPGFSLRRLFQRGEEQTSEINVDDSQAFDEIFAAKDNLQPETTVESPAEPEQDDIVTPEDNTNAPENGAEESKQEE